MKLRWGSVLRWCVTLVVAFGLILLSLCVGPGDFSLETVSRVVLNRFVFGVDSKSLADVILWELRIPRTLLVWVVGASLALAGGISQGMFRNPLADPGVLGISAGAGAAVVA